MDNAMQRFLYPTPRFHGSFKPEYLLFNANLQEFALRVGYISGLHSGGKISSDEAFHQIQELWHMLKLSQELTEMDE